MNVRTNTRTNSGRFGPRRWITRLAANRQATRSPERQNKGRPSRTIGYIFALLLSILFLVGGISAFSTKQAAAQQVTPPVDLTQRGLVFQSMEDPAWADVKIGPKKEPMEKCGCMLSALSMATNYMTGANNVGSGATPHFPVWDLVKWRPDPGPELDGVTPVYLDEYLRTGRTRALGDEIDERTGEPLIEYWGYRNRSESKGNDRCGVALGMTQLSKAVDPGGVVIPRPDGSFEVVGVGIPGILTLTRPGKKFADIDENLRYLMPSIVALRYVQAGTTYYHAQLVVGKNSEGKYLVLDPADPPGAKPFVPTRIAGVPLSGGYEEWERDVTQTTVIKSAPQNKNKLISVTDDPSPFEFLAISPDGRRTGFDPATQTRYEEDSSVFPYETGGRGYRPGILRGTIH